MPTVSLALTDTGTSLLYLDDLDYINLMLYICHDLPCFRVDEQESFRDEGKVWAIRNCQPEQMPDVWFQLDRHQYRLAPQAYIVAMAHEDGSHDCIVQFRQSRHPNGYALLGTAFLVNYFQIYDVTLSQLSLTPIAGDFAGHADESVTGFGEVRIADELDLEKRNIEQGTNAVMLSLAFFVWLLFSLRLRKAEMFGAVDTGYANVH